MESSRHQHFWVAPTPVLSSIVHVVCFVHTVSYSPWSFLWKILHRHRVSNILESPLWLGFYLHSSMKWPLWTHLLATHWSATHCLASTTFCKCNWIFCNPELPVFCMHAEPTLYEQYCQVLLPVFRIPDSTWKTGRQEDARPTWVTEWVKAWTS